MWENIEYIKNIISTSLNKTEVLEKLGLMNHGGNFKSLTTFINDNKINIDHFKDRGKRKVFIKYKNINDILVDNSTYKCTNHLKNRLYREGIKNRECEMCGQGEEWNGRKMSLILDHKNGIPNDNRLENLRILCPNCNATLETHCKGHRHDKKSSRKLYDICKCGGKKRISSKNCKDCYKMIRKKKRTEDNTTKIDFITSMRNRRIVERPSYDILVKEIDEFGYVGTGKKYGVSDNAVRKWIKLYKKYGSDF